MPYHVQHHHHHVARAADPEPEVMTVQETAYVTAAKTFDGPVAGYSTVGAQPTPPAEAGAPVFYDAGSQQAPPAPAATGNSQDNSGLDNKSAFLNPPDAPPQSSQSSQPSQPAESPVVPVPQSTLVSSKSVAQSPSSHTSAVPTTTSVASSASSDSPSSAAGAQQNESSPTSTAAPAAPEKTTTTGMTSGAQAGLAIGMLALVGILVAIAYLFYRRRVQKQREGQQKLDDEKSYNEKTGFDQMQPGLVPRVSVRRQGEQAPRLSMRPTTEMFGPQMSERSDSHAGFASAAVAGARADEPEHDKRREPQNPFGDHAATPVEAPKPLNISRPSTPNGQESAAPSADSSAAAAAAGPDGSQGPMNVHRVQLEFLPSMDDELGLQAGQLVRMLHEYDDGWALCIRLDRSQQGVVPRSCISKLPVKPRGGPPPGARRGPPPPGQRTRPGQSPASSPRMRSQTNAPQGRPMSPAANPFDDSNRSRSNSAGNPNPTRSPPGASPLNPQ